MALILRNGGSQSPDRWLREPRNNHTYSTGIIIRHKNNRPVNSKFLVVWGSLLIYLIVQPLHFTIAYPRLNINIYSFLIESSPFLQPSTKKTRRTEVLRVSYVWTQRYLAITNLYSD